MKEFLLSQFLFLHIVVCGFVTSRSQLRFVAVVGENDSLSFFFQAVTDRCAPAFGAFFFTGSRSEEEGAEAHGPEDRPSAGRSSFFLLPWNCLQFVLKAFSFSRQALSACCCNTPGIHNKLAGNASDRARTAVHAATNKVVEILFLRTYLLLDRSFDYLRASLSNGRDTPL